MSICEKIDEIISKRKGIGKWKGNGMLDKVREKKEFYQSLLNALNGFQTQRDFVLKSIQEKIGVYYQLTANDPNFEENISDSSAQKAISEVHNAIVELETLERRFDRDTINISVVGMARQGKSRLLQSISGVDNEVIPADGGGDCTGAKSSICNEPESDTYANVLFYSDTELIEIVQKYIDELNLDIKLNSINQIKRIDCKTVDQSKYSNKQVSYFEKLTDYVEHYDDYNDFVGSEIKVPKEEIRKFVAQKMQNGTKTYAFLAVKNVEIHTPFVYKDSGKIMLVDTIGLGDASSIGLQKKLIETLVNDSDAAILLRRPDPKGDHISDSDVELVDKINDEMKGRDLSKWLYYVLNTFGDNRETSDILKEKLKKRMDSSLHVSFIEQIDCADKAEVEDKLIEPLLTKLSDNLNEIDESLMCLADKKLQSAYDEVYALNSKLSNLINEGLLQTIEGGDLFDELFEDRLNLGAKLKELNREYIDRKKRNEELESSIKEILINVKNLIPTENEIINSLQKGDLSEHTETVYNRYADNLRSKIRNEFDDVCRSVIEKLQDDIRCKIIEVFYEDGCLKHIPLITLNSSNQIEWLKCVVQEKISEGNLRDAFNEILNYRLHIEGLLQFKVHCALDYLQEKSIEDSPEGLLPRLSGEFKDMSISDKAKVIRETLLSLLPEFARTLMQSVDELLIIPNNSFNSLIQKVRDRLFYQKDGERDLKKFYRANCISIWHDEFKQISQRNEAAGVINELTSAFLEFGEKQNYLFNIN